MIKRPAYTLVEILVTIGIILILSTIVVAVINPSLQRNRANDAILVKSVGEVAGALEIYKSVEGAYPTNSDDDLNALTSYIGPAFTIYKADSSIIGFNNESIESGTAVNSIYWDSVNECLQTKSLEDNSLFIRWTPGTEVTVSSTNCSSEIDSLAQTDDGPDPSEVVTSPSGGGTLVGGEFPNVIPTELLAFYRFSEGSGTAMVDSTGNGNDGALSTSSIWSIGRYGSGIFTDSTGEYGVVNGNLFGNPRSVSLAAWVQTDISSGSEEVISIGDYIALRIRSTSVEGFFYKGGITNRWLMTVGNTDITDGGWHHIVYTFDDVGNRQSLYIDGILSTTTNYTEGINYADILGDSTYIGTHGSLKPNYDFRGKIDEVRIYEGALTPDEVLQIYNETDIGPLAHWALDEGSGTSVVDSVSGITGTVENNASWQASSSCISGACMFFDGSDSAQRINTNQDFSWSSNEPFTIMAWVNMRNPQTSTFLGKGLTGSSWEYSFRIGGSSGLTPNFVYWNTGASPAIVVVSNQDLTPQEWHHLAVTFNGFTTKLFLDGTLTATQDGVTGTFQNRSNTLNLGSSYFVSGAAGYFPGLIDEVKIYNYDLTEGQIGIEASQSKPTVTFEPLGSWSLDETTGINAPNSGTLGSSANGLLVNGTSWTSDSHSGRAANFDGINDYIRIPNNSSFNMVSSYTLAAWVKVDNLAASNEHFVINRYNWSLNAGYGINILNTGEVRCDFNGSLGKFRTGYVVTPGEWNHLICLWNGQNLTFYANGVNTASTSRTGLANYNTALHIGTPANAVGNDNFTLDGKIDEVKIYNYAISGEQIAALSEASEIPSTFPNPFAHWKFDENSGNTISNSGTAGSSLSGSLSGGSSTPSWTSTAKDTAALDFDGTDDSAIVPDNSTLDLNQFTVSAWVKPRSMPANGSPTYRVIARRTTGYTAYNQGYWLVYSENAGGFLFGVANGGWWKSEQGFLHTPDDTWVHVVGTYDGSTVKIYKNGVLQDSESFNGNISNTSENLYIGKDTGDRPFNGVIDELRIYDYALTESQVLEEYNSLQ